MPTIRGEEVYEIKTPVQFENGDFLTIHTTVSKDKYHNKMSDNGQIGKYVHDKYDFDVASLIYQKEFAKIYNSSGMKLEGNEICRKTDWQEDVVIDIHGFENFAEDLINYCDSSPKILGDKDIYAKADKLLEYLENTYKKYVIYYAVAIDEDESGELFFVVYVYNYDDDTPEYPSEFDGTRVTYLSGKRN